MKLSILHTSTLIALISVECSPNVDGSALVSTSALFVSAVDLAGSLTSASVARVLGRGSLGEGLSKVEGSAIVVAVARVVGAGDLSVGLASASVAAVGSRLSDSQSGSLVLAVARDWVVLAVHLSVLHALALVASVSLVDSGADLDGSSIVGAGADFVVAHNIRILVALAGLASISVTNSSTAERVFLSIVVALAFLVAASDHSRLSAGA